MSSHHFVKDKQEPALIIANGEACSIHLLEELLEWNPFILTLDGALDRIVDLGIKPDAIIGDFDSIKNLEETLEKIPDILKIYKPDQEFTDLDKGIQYLIDEGYPAANIVWATGKRLDHSITNFFNMARYKNQIQLCMIDDFSKKYIIPEKFEKWYPASTSLSLIPCGEVKNITTSGLDYPLINENLVLGFRAGTSNFTSQDGIVRIEHETGILFLIENFNI